MPICCRPPASAPVGSLPETDLPGSGSPAVPPPAPWKRRTAALSIRRSPREDIFLLACKEAQIPPERSLVLEDSEPGAKAAKAAGIPCIIVPDINYPKKEVAEGAEMIAKSLLDVEKLFAVITTNI